MRWPLMFQHDLCRTEDMAGRHQAHLDVADLHALAVFQRLLRGVGHVLEAGAHDRQRLGRGQRAAMAGPGMVAMAMGDHGAGHRHGGVDIEVARLTIEAARRRIEPGARIQGVGRSLNARHPTPQIWGFRTCFHAGSKVAAGRPARISSRWSIWPARQERAADRADRRRQDFGRISAVADRAHRAPPRRQGPRACQGQGRAAHALHLAAQGAGDRHPPQSRAADRRDAAAGARREPHRRHAAEPPAAPARAAARPADDDAGIAGAAAVLSRRREVLREPALRHHRRAALLRDHQARPSPGALPRAAGAPCRRRRASSACRPRSPIRRSWPTTCACATTSGRDRAGRARRAAQGHHHRRPGAPAVGRPHGPSRGARGLQHHPPAQDLDRVRQHARPGRAGVRRVCGASTTTTWRSACITARSRSSSAARSRRRWRPASCAPWWRPRRSISASTGATSIW